MNRILDGEPSGLYYYRARMYSPTLGRFMQPDPIGYQGGVHLYAYVGNDPLNRIDPSGLMASDLFAAVANSIIPPRENGISSIPLSSNHDGRRDTS